MTLTGSDYRVSLPISANCSFTDAEDPSDLHVAHLQAYCLGDGIHVLLLSVLASPMRAEQINEGTL